MERLNVLVDYFLELKIDDFHAAPPLPVSYDTGILLVFIQDYTPLQ